MNIRQKLYCLLGLHGPVWYREECYAATIVGVMHRKCMFCGTEWLGTECRDNRSRWINWKRRVQP